MPLIMSLVIKETVFLFPLGQNVKEDRIEFVPKMHPSHTSLTKLVLLFQFFGGQKQEFVSGFFFSILKNKNSFNKRLFVLGLLKSGYVILFKREKITSSIE